MIRSLAALGVALTRAALVASLTTAPALAQVQPSAPVASKGYVDTGLAAGIAATALEKARAQAAEGLLLPKAGGTMTGPVVLAPGSTGPGDGLSVAPTRSTIRRALRPTLDDLPLSPENFRGGDCANAPDDTCALQATIDAACASRTDKVALSGEYWTISNTLSMLACYGIDFGGRSYFSNTITMTDSTKSIIDIGGLGNNLHDLKLTYAGTPQDSATAIRWSGRQGFLQRVHIMNVWDGVIYKGVQGDSVNGNIASDLSIENYKNTALTAQWAADLYVSHFIFSAGPETNGALGGIRLVDQVEAALFDHGSVLGGAYGLTTDATVNAPDKRPAYGRFDTVFFDSNAKGNLLNKMAGFVFTAPWFSGGRSGPGYPSVTITDSRDLSFVAPQFYNSGAAAVEHAPSNRNIRFIDPSIQNAGATTKTSSCGFNFQAGSTDFSVKGGTAGNDLSNPAAYGTNLRYAVCVQGNSNRYTVRDMNVATPGMLSDAAIYEGPNNGPQRSVGDNWTN